MALKYLALLVLCVVKVNCMALKGPPLTRYDPCGLGVIHFDRLMTNYWQSVLHLGLYKNLLEVEIEIYFEKKVTIFGVSHNSSVLSLGEHGFRIQPRGPVPQQFKFYMILEGLGENEPDVPTVTKFTLNNVTLCSADIKKNQTVESLDVTKKDEKHHKHICGRRSLDHTELVSVRTEAKAGDWPWHVAIFIKDLASNTMSYYCGGNIISKTAIVTAGHCVIKDGQRVTADRIVVVAGTNNHKEVGQIGRQSLPVKEVVLHPNYDGQATSDVAILKVDRFKYTAYVQPICVWGPVYDKQNLIGRHATQKTKWSTSSGQLTEGMLVLVRDKAPPPLNWALGRVVRTYPGPDGVTRVADIKTRRGYMTRGFNNICPLPLEEVKGQEDVPARATGLGAGDVVTGAGSDDGGA
ncbi:uncharacterized protein LOC135073974 isoform X2 [Ostrinia nubilalis]|uniref:uncharacterized protein LOC135073974 isoform X2 n=1 Tax=Ostrinia nubilalis TaxID=29057 RepID=UPI0030822471